MSLRTNEMERPMRVEVLRSERLFDGFFKFDRAYLRHETPSGQMSPEIMRLNLEHGDGAAVLLINRDTNSVVLTRQFRYAAWLRGETDFSIEIPAGIVADDRTPVQTARSELLEE